MDHAWTDMNTDSFSPDSYDYPLPEELIAQYPPLERGLSRLLVLDRSASTLTDTMFARLPEYLPSGALLVANNSRVSPARLLGVRPTGGKAELLLLTPPPLLERQADSTPSALLGPGASANSVWRSAVAQALLKPGKNIKPGDTLHFGLCIKAEVLAKYDFGRHEVRLFWQGDLSSRLDEVGHIPLPPYIKRPQNQEDRTRYQTAYARADKAGSVAAPTAGLHFTRDMRNRLEAAGFGWAEVTLHVGYGTFSPVREPDIRQHAMHGEYVEISAAAVQAVLDARQTGRPVFAVGTTSARTLEGAAQACGNTLPPGGWQGWTNIFIYPGFRFQMVDGLLTNFHLPKSSLLMLVSALVGRENVLDAYAFAVRQKYRFFSYGDAMLIR